MKTENNYELLLDLTKLTDIEVALIFFTLLEQENLDRETGPGRQTLLFAQEALERMNNPDAARLLEKEIRRHKFSARKETIQEAGANG